VNHRSPNLNIALAGILSIALSGCGGAYDSAVTGLVTLDGTPVPRGTVAYSPQGGGPAAFGLIGADGTYLLRTGREEGLPAGQYSVTVAANEQANWDPSKGGGPPPPGKPITPEWYRDVATSGLSFNVEPGDQEINLELNSKPPVGWKPPRPLPASRPR
jgi:hypothetical protein